MSFSFHYKIAGPLCTEEHIKKENWQLDQKSYLVFDLLPKKIYGAGLFDHSMSFSRSIFQFLALACFTSSALAAEKSIKSIITGYGNLVVG